MIHERMQKYVAQMTRISIRVVRVTLGRKNSKIHIQIISAYAPHNGHTEEGRRHHWMGVREILSKTR